VDAEGRPAAASCTRSGSDGADLVGWIATEPTPLKRAHLAAHPDISISYWTTNHGN
jgi:hypothetical protein